MPEAGDIGVGAPTTRETTRVPEAKNSRETVINAFNSAYTIFESCPEDKLTTTQQASRDLIKEIKGKTLDKGKTSYLKRFESESGEKFSQREYLPVDELMLFLKERVKSGELTTEDETEYLRLGQILFKNSKEYYRIRAKKEDPRWFARVTQEAGKISSNPRITNGNPRDDFLDAGRILLKRRELIIPPPPPESPPPPTEVPPPEPEGEPEPEPEAESLEQIRREFTIINRNTDIQRKARELANEALRSQMAGEPIPNRVSAGMDRSERIRENTRYFALLLARGLNPISWPKRFGLRIMEEFHRQRYIQRASRAMLENNNSYLSMDVVRNTAVDAAHQASQEREAGREKVEAIKIHATEGMIREGETILEAQGALKETIINDIIRPIIEARVTDEAQVQQALRDFVQNHQEDPQVQAVFGRDATQYGRLAEYFATDLLETGELVRQDIAANRYSLELLDSIIQIRLANTSSWGGETQARLSAVDKAVSWAESHRLTGALINPATLGAGFSIATFGLMRGLGAGAKITQFVVPGAGLLPGALFAAARRNHDLKVDMATHRVEKAYNDRQTSENAKRRLALDKYSYETALATNLIDGGGQEGLTGTDRLSIKTLISRDLSEGQTSNREAVVRRIAEIETRLNFSARERVDLITFQTREQVEQGRFSLDRAIVESRHALLNAGMGRDEIQELESRFSGEWNSRFTQNREQQDRAFAHYRLRNAAGAAVFGGTAGLVGGYAIKEALEHSGINLGELIGGAQSKIKDFKDMFHHQSGHTDVGNYRFEVNPDHSVLVTDTHTGNVVLDHGITVQENGHLLARGDTTSQAVLDELHKKGFEIKSGPDIQNTLLNSEPGTLHTAIGGNDTLIPQGTHWVQDQQTGNFNLVVDSRPDKILVNEYNPSTHAFDAAHSVINPETALQSETKPTFGPDGLWDKNGTQLTRQWYGNNTPYSDLNELRAYNSVFTASDGQKGVVWDMSQMQESFQNGNVPPVVDVHGVVQHGQAVFAFSSADHQGNPIIISDLSDGVADGKFTLDPTDYVHHIDPNNPNSMFVGDFSKLVLNQQELSKIPDGTLASELYNHRDVFNLAQNGKPGFMEAGQLVRGPDVNTLQVFATGEGTGEIPTGIPIPHELTTFNLNAPIVEHINSFDILPPGSHPEIPIIPIPFAPRHPLESQIENILILYGYGGSYSGEGLGWVDRSEYEKRRSKTLNENPYAKLDESTEVADYLSRMDPEYRRELERMDDTIGTPMTSETRTVITIPAFGEGKIIRKTLEQFLNQKDKKGNPIDPNLFEIIVFENDTEQRQKDETEEEIRKFKADHPELKVYYAYRRWSTEDIASKVNTVGNGRRYNCDLALLRSSKRKTATGELIVINNDADLEGIKPRYITDVIEQFDSKNYLDVVVGKRNLPDWALRKPNVRAGQRLWEIFDSVMRHTGGGDEMSPDKREKGWPGMIGENSAMRASIYAAVGGYGPHASLAEDQNLGDMIRAARNYDDQRFEYINRLQTIKNPRRYLTYVIAGRPLIDMYNDYHENKDIRDLDNAQLLKRISDTFDLNRFQLDADGIYQKINDYTHLGGDAFDLRFKKMMQLMGVVYVIENGHVKILNVDKLLEGLKRPIPSSNPTASSKPAPTSTP